MKINFWNLKQERVLNIFINTHRTLTLSAADRHMVSLKGWLSSAMRAVIRSDRCMSVYILAYTAWLTNDIAGNVLAVWSCSMSTIFSVFCQQ